MTSRLGTIILFLIFSAAITSSAATEQRIGIIDLRRVFDEYYKTVAADQFLKEKATKLEKERKGQLEVYQKATEEYKQAMEDANNQAISADERDKRKKAAEGKMLEIKEMENSINTFDRSARGQLEEEQRQARDKILTEIRSSISKKAKAAGYNLVVDIAAETINKTPVVMYNDGGSDLTAEILVELNANAPPEFLRSSSTNKPSSLFP